MRRSLATSLTVLVAALSATAAPADSSGASTGRAAASDPGTLVIQYEKGVTAAERTATRRTHGVRLARRLEQTRTEVVTTLGKVRTTTKARELTGDADVALAAPNYRLDLQSVPNDRWFGRQWNLLNTGQNANFFDRYARGGLQPAAGVAGADIGVTEAWDRTKGDRSVIVAVNDTGVDFYHPDLKTQTWRNPGESGSGRETNKRDDDGNGYVDDFAGWDFAPTAANASQDNIPEDPNGHGTFVAGAAGARGDDGVGITGVAPGTTLMPIKIAGGGNAAFGAGNLADVVAGLHYAAANGARVSSNSYLFPSLTDPNARALIRNAIAAHPETLYVFAAGNGGADYIGDDVDAGDTGDRAVYPCEAPEPNVICVAATDQADRLAGFSNYGSTGVDIGAPGVDVLGTSANPSPFVSNPTTAAQFAADWPTRVGGWGQLAQGGVDGDAVSDSPVGNYAPKASGGVISRYFTVPASYAGCRVNYLTDVRLAAGDTAKVDVLSGNTSIAARSYTSASPRNARDTLAVPASRPSTAMRVRVTLVGNGDAKVADGMSVRDVHFECSPKQGFAGDYAYAAGTSMATPNVAGAAALLLSAKPDLTVAEVRSALLDNGDPIPALAGKTASGRRLDVGRSMATLP